MVLIRQDETIDDLLINGLQIIQKAKGFRFSIDAVLLSHFCTVKEGEKIIDLGTGTGVIPLLLSSRLEKYDIVGVEIQKELAEMTQRSINLNKIKGITIIESDFRKLPREYNNLFDLVISNPPYFPINSGRINPNPQIAVSRHEIKCTLPELVATTGRLLKAKGRFAFIYRAERLDGIIKELSLYNLGIKRMRFIYPNQQKPANLVLIEAIKGIKSNIIIEKPLVIYQGNGKYTEEILDYYGGETYGN